MCWYFVLTACFLTDTHSIGRSGRAAGEVRTDADPFGGLDNPLPSPIVELERHFMWQTLHTYVEWKCGGLGCKRQFGWLFLCKTLEQKENAIANSNLIW